LRDILGVVAGFGITTMRWGAQVVIMPNYFKRLTVSILVVSGACCAAIGFIRLTRVLSASAEATSSDSECVSCHEKVFDHLPSESVHRPFEEKKCFDCHQFQFPSRTEHSFTFPQLAFDHTFSFRLKGMGNPSLVSAIYSFSPKEIDINGAAVNFPGTEDFPLIEIIRDVHRPEVLSLRWRTSEPKRCMVEWGEQPSFGQSGAMDQVQSAHAERLPLGVEIGINACYQCHPKSKLGVSHPVNVLPSQKIKEKMKMAGLPTGKGGLLLCVTCHIPHASSQSFLGRRAVSEELCVACHSKEIYNPQ